MTSQPPWMDEHFRLALEAAPSGQIVVDDGGMIVLVNGRVVDLFGYTAAEVIGRPVECLIPDRFRSGHAALRDGFICEPTVRAMGTGRDLYGRRADGSEVPVEVGLNPFTVDGRTWVLASVVDVSERRRAADRWKVLLDASPNGLLLVDRQQRIVLLNRQIETVFGYRREELVGRPIETLVPERFRDQHPEHVGGFFAAPSVREMGAGRDLYGLRRDGSEVPVEIGLNPIELDDGLYVLASVVDISERKRIEDETRQLHDQLQHGQRLESLGLLAGGIAHDFNNILVAILGHADLAELELPPNSELRRHIQLIQKATIRASDLTKQMLAYAGKGQLASGPVDLNALVRDMSSLLEVSIAKKVVLRTDLAEGLPEVDGDAAQLQQVVMNLITNASEAIGHRSGMISIHTGAVKADASYLAGFEAATLLQEGYYVFLEVADTGCGMTDEVRQRLFDPFFTTKFTGRGLGMAAVLGIVRGHGGGIQVYSEADRGTKFKILLPMLRRPDTGEMQRLRELPALNSDGRRALIIDDEEHVRGVLSMMLTKCGFDSLMACDGREGLLVYQANRQDIAVVFIDVNMPMMSGDEVFKELRRMDSAAKLILMSGYDQRSATLPLAGKAFDGYLQKPFLFTRVVEVLKAALA